MVQRGGVGVAQSGEGGLDEAQLVLVLQGRVEDLHLQHRALHAEALQLRVGGAHPFGDQTALLLEEVQRAVHHAQCGFQSAAHTSALSSLHEGKVALALRLVVLADGFPGGQFHHAAVAVGQELLLGVGGAQRGAEGDELLVGGAGLLVLLLG